MLASECVPVVLLMVALFYVPQSPRWLMQKNRLEEARQVIRRIDPSNVENEMAEIKKSLSEETGTWGELFQPDIRIALLIAVALAFFQQWTGSSTMAFYAPIIFQKAGFGNSSAIGQMALLNSWNIFCTIIAMSLVDKVGRRPLLLFGVAGMAISQIIMGLFFHFNMQGVYVALAFYLCSGTYAISLAPLTWLIVSEIFPTRIRARGMSIGSSVCWISAYGAVQFLGQFMKVLEVRFGTPAGAFWLFAGVCVIALIFSYKIVPETKGKTLEEVTHLF